MKFIAEINKNLNKYGTKKYLTMQKGDVPRIGADVMDLVENLGYKSEALAQKGIFEFVKWQNYNKV